MKKSLANSNPYLRNKSLKREMVKRFVSSSSAIEGIHIKRKSSSVKKASKKSSRSAYGSSRRARSSSR